MRRLGHARSIDVDLPRIGNDRTPSKALALGNIFSLYKFISVIALDEELLRYETCTRVKLRK